MEKEITKGYKFRIYPNENQKKFIDNILNSYRFFYNKSLEEMIEYKSTNVTPSKNQLFNKLKNIKVSYKFDLNLQNTIINEAIFQSFKYFNNKNREDKKVKFKSKFNKTTISLFSKQINLKLDFKNKVISLFNQTKIKAKGMSENIIPKTRVYLSKTLDDKYFISYNSKTTYKILSPPKRKKRIGIDLGLKTLITTSEGKTILNEKIFGRMQSRISSLQRKLSKEEKGSRNYVKTKIALQRAYDKVSNIRNDYLNKISYKIIKNYTFIGIENLDIKMMEKEKLFSKSLTDACFGILIKNLEYKASWNNRMLIKVDRYFPSSQLCSHCGFKNKEVKDLSIREWTCTKCHTHHNRDVNAAKNILKEAYRIGLVNLGINEIKIKKIIQNLFSY